MNNIVIGTVIDMDISHMRAGIAIDRDTVVEVKVGKIYDTGEEIKIYNIQDLPKPWYLLGTEWIDKNPISEAEIMREYIQGVRVG